jgi:hypothetical protein
MGQDDEGYGNEIYGHSQWLLGRFFINWIVGYSFGSQDELRAIGEIGFCVVSSYVFVFGSYFGAQCK